MHKLNPEALIPDMRMPGSVGMDVLLEIKRNKQTPLVVVLADYPLRHYRTKYVEARADFLFDESTEFDQVMAVLKRLGKNPY